MTPSQPSLAAAAPFWTGLVGGVLAAWLVSLGGAQPAARADQLLPCPAPPASTPLQNGVISDGGAAGENVIILGSIPDRPYVVAIPGDSETTLNQLRQCISDAFVTTARLGPFLQAGIFASHGEAKGVSDWLRSQGFDARVIYRP